DDSRNRALEHCERPSGDVAAAPAAVAVAGEAERRVLRRHLTVLAPRAVDRANDRTKLDLAVREIEHVVTIVGATLGKRLALVPAFPRAAEGIADLEVLILVRLEDRVVLQLEDLTGGPVARAELFQLLPRRVRGGDERADWRRGDGVDLGWLAERRRGAARPR